MPAELTVGTRLSRRFAELKARGEMGIIAYITAGDPSFAATLKFVQALAEAGTDVIELGVPFSDPLADGPLQAATERSAFATPEVQSSGERFDTRKGRRACRCISAIPIRRTRS